MKDVAPPIPTRDRILDAASRVVVREGTRSLTVASVAAEAGLSKGGVLHHFPSKEEMATAMLDRAIAAWDTAIDAAMAVDPEPQGRMARAYVRISLADDSPQKRELDRLSTAITAMLLSYPERMGALDLQSRRFVDRLDADGPDPILSHIVRLAVDGMWLIETLGFTRFDPALRAAVAQRLLAMTAPNSLDQGRTT